MTSRATILLILAAIAGLVWLNLQMFGVLDATIDRLAAQRMVSKMVMSVGKVEYACYSVRRAE